MKATSKVTIEILDEEGQTRDLVMHVCGDMTNAEEFGQTVGIAVKNAMEAMGDDIPGPLEVIRAMLYTLRANTVSYQANEIEMVRDALARWLNGEDPDEDELARVFGQIAAERKEIAAVDAAALAKLKGGAS